jgi:hypothetical protein
MSPLFTGRHVGRRESSDMSEQSMVVALKMKKS